MASGQAQSGRPDDAFMRRKAVADYLGISRHTLARLMRSDATFPRFITISPGVHVVRFGAVRRWLAEREYAARVAPR